MQLHPDNIDRVIKACSKLHNFVRKRDGVNFEDTESHPFVDVNNCGRCAQQEVVFTSGVREYLADYFMGPGAVPFQQRYMF